MGGRELDRWPATRKIIRSKLKGNNIKMAATKILERLEEWQQKGPFRVWRKANKLSMRKAAAYLGVNLYTIQSWENGDSFPKPENMNMLIQALDDPELRNKWYSWWKDGPEGEGSKHFPGVIT